MFKKFLSLFRSQLESLISHLHSNNMTIHVPSPSMSPSIPPMMMNGSYVINGTAGLYLTLDSDTSKILVNSNYKVRAAELYLFFLMYLSVLFNALDNLCNENQYRKRYIFLHMSREMQKYKKVDPSQNFLRRTLGT